MHAGKPGRPDVAVAIFVATRVIQSFEQSESDCDSANRSSRGLVTMRLGPRVSPVHKDPSRACSVCVQQKRRAHSPLSNLLLQPFGLYYVVVSHFSCSISVLTFVSVTFHVPNTRAPFQHKAGMPLSFPFPFLCSPFRPCLIDSRKQLCP